jgi:transcriptional regulator with XRE-family HTH domain
MSDTTNNLVTLAAILRSRRRALLLTQEDVGDLCNVQRQTIGRLENADPTVSLGTAMTVADVLGVDLSLSTDDTR